PHVMPMQVATRRAAKNGRTSSTGKRTSQFTSAAIPPATMKRPSGRSSARRARCVRSISSPQPRKAEAQHQQRCESEAGAILDGEGDRIVAHLAARAQQPDAHHEQEYQRREAPQPARAAVEAVPERLL